MQDSSTHPPADDRLRTETMRSAGSAQDDYEVVARRYRPRRFDELVGQTGLASALQNAILHHRVGHAYLFTGARGVGKTSTARIFSKALNCEEGPAAEPCGSCEICEGITSGSDVDVLEIDGASNRGIDEIRQLRSNVSVRPSRSRFKIYIIDEVHMLTPAAFNALLKTLEEPPAHVKFIFCTTDPEKIPITVLSRCQRFDFAPVTIEDLIDKLRSIVSTEQFEADEDAIRLVARRAAGSVRDSQSLLEQLMAFCSERITLDDVHQLMGTVRGGQLIKWVQQLQSRDAAGALSSLDDAIHEGADVGQLGEQLLGAFRDALALTVGCGPEQVLHIDAADAESLLELGKQTGVPNLLAMAQIVDQTLTRMRQSTEPRILLEIALVRICTLEDLTELAALVEELGNSVAPRDPKASPEQRADVSKKNESNPDPTGVADPAHALPNRKESTLAERLSAGNSATLKREREARPGLDSSPAALESKQSSDKCVETQGRAALEADRSSQEIRDKTVIAQQAATSRRSNEHSARVDERSSDAFRPTAESNRIDPSHKSDQRLGSERAFANSINEPHDPNAQLQEAGRGETGDHLAVGSPNSPRGTTDSDVRPPVAGESNSPRIPSNPPADGTELWQKVVEKIGDTTADLAGDFCRAAISGPNSLVVTLNSPYNKEMCDRPERRSRLEKLLSEFAGRPMRLEFDVTETGRPESRTAPSQRVTMQQRMRDITRHPFVKQAIETLDAEVEDVQPPRSGSTK